MSSINFNDYTNYANYDTGYDFSALMGGTTNSSGNLKAYYAKQDAENAAASGDSRQKLTLMRSSADSLKKSADALNNASLWEKKKIKKKDEKTGEETEVEDYHRKGKFTGIGRGRMKGSQYYYIEITI